MSKKQDILWIVACNNLHGATGPFHDVMEAIASASELTKADTTGCVYQVVPFIFRGMLMNLDEVDMKIPDPDKYDWEGGQYL